MKSVDNKPIQVLTVIGPVVSEKFDTDKQTTTTKVINGDDDCGGDDSSADLVGDGSAISESWW